MNRHSSPLSVVAASLVLALVIAAPSAANEEERWPRQLDTPEASITVYQPQPQGVEGTTLTGRSAVSVTRAGEEDPVFGTVWFTARIAVDRDTRIVDVLDVQVSRVRVPDATEEGEQWLTSTLENSVEKADLSISLDRLSASLEVIEERRKAAEGLNDAPPKIVLSEEPAVLVTLDGEPRLRSLEDTGFKYVVNTPFMIVLVEKSDTFYLYAGNDRWYSASAAKGPWVVAASVPKDVEKLAPEDPPLPEDVEEEISKLPTPTSPPKIVVTTEPTELLLTDGKPNYAPLEGGDLLYVTNSDDDILVEVASQRHYVLLAGRWFAAPGLDGPWDMVPADELPESFASIPTDSEMSHLRTWVAGTEEAEEALLDAQVPQTAAIKRDSTIEVTWDGDPEFKKIDNTELAYGVNTPEQVLMHENRYYSVDQGVWYTANNPQGPWSVATHVPDAIYQQPASSPVYNTTYVHVYEATPTVVYTGYYPGYTNSYIYHGVPVYGTGWYYPPYWGHHYYPRPATWGFHVRYNPWYGWSFGVSYSTGRFTFGLGFGGWGGGYHRGWWGPVGYRPYYRAGYGHGYRHGYRAGYRSGQRRGPNLYARPANGARNARPVTTRGAAPNVARNKANNVYSDRDGNVYRRQADGNWQQNRGGKWESSQLPAAGASTRDRSAGAAERPATGTRPSTPAQRPTTGTRPSTSMQRPTARPNYGGSGNLNRDYSARQRGSSRAQSYGRSGGARRGGGGRRR